MKENHTKGRVYYYETLIDKLVLFVFKPWYPGEFLQCRDTTPPHHGIITVRITVLAAFGGPSNATHRHRTLLFVTLLE